MLNPIYLHGIESSTDTLLASNPQSVAKDLALLLIDNPKQGVEMVEKAKKIVEHEEELVLLMIEKPHSFFELFGKTGPDHDYKERMMAHIHDQAIKDLMLIVRTCHLGKVSIAFTCPESEVSQAIDELKPRFICRPNMAPLSASVLNGNRDKYPILYL